MVICPNREDALEVLLADVLEEGFLVIGVIACSRVKHVGASQVTALVGGLLALRVMLEAGCDHVDDAEARMLFDADERRIRVARQTVIAYTLLHEVNAVQFVALVVDVLLLGSDARLKQRADP